MTRQLETRQLLDDGWTTEWEPASLGQAHEVADNWKAPQEARERLHRALVGPMTPEGWRRLVRALNEVEKASGSNVRWRSVEKGCCP